MSSPHPLDPLGAEEIRRAAAVVRADPRAGPEPRFAHVGLVAPDRALLRRFGPGDPVERRLRLSVVTGPEAEVTEVVVALGPSAARDRVASWTVHPDARPVLLMEEAVGAIACVRADPLWRAAMAARGIEDVDQVQIDPWPAGSFEVEHEAGRRICRCLSYLRDRPDANGYARPIEGVLVFVDMARQEVLEVVDTGVVPVPAGRGSYYPEDLGPPRADLAPIEITQPEGPSFSVEGNAIAWQRWSLRVSMDAIEGLVLGDITYEDRGRRRAVCARASVDEMVVPYGDPGPMHGWKNAFDVGEWGIGRMANSLERGCDCLGEIRYLDAVMATERGEPYTVANAVCIHEEDVGILWKHVDLMSGRVEVRRARRLVVSSIATVGNYEYGFYWYFYLDGTIELEVKLSGILSPMAVAPGERPRFATVVAPGVAAPFHQHLFNVRLDLDIDGGPLSLEEVEAAALPPGPENPWRSAFEARVTPLRSEDVTGRDVDPATSRHWRVVNRRVRNALGQPVAYKLVPGATPTLLADPSSSVGRRAGFATRSLWATPADPAQRRAAGEFPNQHRGGDGVDRWTLAERSIEDCDLVLWYTFGLTHFPRPEDWPVMPVERVGFSLVPVGFFDENPALDVPPPTGACHQPAE